MTEDIFQILSARKTQFETGGWLSSLTGTRLPFNDTTESSTATAKPMAKKWEPKPEWIRAEVPRGERYQELRDTGGVAAVLSFSVHRLVEVTHVLRPLYRTVSETPSWLLNQRKDLKLQKLTPLWALELFGCCELVSHFAQ